MSELDDFRKYLDDYCVVLEGMRNGNFLVANFKEKYVSITDLRARDESWGSYRSKVVGNFLENKEKNCLGIFRFFNTSVYYILENGNMVFTSLIRKTYKGRVDYCVRLIEFNTNRSYSIVDKEIISMDISYIPSMSLKDNKLVDCYVPCINGDKVSISFSLEDDKGVLLNCTVEVSDMGIRSDIDYVNFIAFQLDFNGEDDLPF